jgi:hypothetical protein
MNVIFRVRKFVSDSESEVLKLWLQERPMSESNDNPSPSHVSRWFCAKTVIKRTETPKKLKQANKPITSLSHQRPRVSSNKIKMRTPQI